MTFLTFCLSNKNKVLLEKYNHLIDEKRFENTMNSITLNSLDANLMNDKSIIIYFGRSDCQDCNVFDKTLTEYLRKNDVNNLFYVDLGDFHRKSDISAWNHFKARYGFNETPALIRFTNGEKDDMIQQSGTNGITYGELANFIGQNS